MSRIRRLLTTRRTRRAVLLDISVAARRRARLSHAGSSLNSRAPARALGLRRAPQTWSASHRACSDECHATRRARCVPHSCFVGRALALAGAITALFMVGVQPAEAHVPYLAAAWGSNRSGQLGDGITEGPQQCSPAGEVPCSTSPVPVTGLEGVTAISGGEEHSLALLGGGTVKAWGNNELGQLGDGNPGELEPESNLPVTVRGLCCATSIAAGARHSLALLTYGEVEAWGSDESGQLADAKRPELHPTSDVPVTVRAPVGLLTGVVALAAGEEHSLALLNNGTVMAWGENAHGQLGDGTTTNRDVPVAVKGLTGVVAIAAGLEHSLALISNGTIMAWGANSEGQLGTGANNGPEECGPPTEEEACSTAPVPVTGLSYLDVKGIAAGSWHSLAFGPPNPTVTAVSPREGLEVGGTVVTITGREFTGATAVKFGSTSAVIYKVESATSIMAVSPEGTGTVDITVTTPEGTSPTSSADRFSYAAPTLPGASASR